MGGLFGGGDQRVCWPPLSNYWGGGGPLPTPMVSKLTKFHNSALWKQKRAMAVPLMSKKDLVS